MCHEVRQFENCWPRTWWIHPPWNKLRNIDSITSFIIASISVVLLSSLENLKLWGWLSAIFSTHYPCPLTSSWVKILLLYLCMQERSEHLFWTSVIPLLSVHSEVYCLNVDSNSTIAFLIALQWTQLPSSLILLHFNGSMFSSYKFLSLCHGSHVFLHHIM